MRVISPVPRYKGLVVRLARRPGTLDGALIGVLDNWGSRNPDGTTGMYPLMAELVVALESRFKIERGCWIKKAKAGSPPTPEEFSRLTRESNVVINGVCLSGGSTSGSIYDAVALETAGVPTVTLCHPEFENMSRRYATALGMADLALLVVPAPTGGNLAQDASSTAGQRIDEVVLALTDPTIVP
jgi:hypothetical protein